MDIQKERELFEQLKDIAAMMAENPGIEFENGKYVYYGLDGRTAFAAVYISGAWAGWQAKAQAVLEGFVLVSRDTLNKALNPNDYDEAVCSANELLAVIEAQEKNQ